MTSCPSFSSKRRIEGHAFDCFTQRTPGPVKHEKLWTRASSVTTLSRPMNNESHQRSMRCHLTGAEDMRYNLKPSFTRRFPSRHSCTLSSRRGSRNFKSVTMELPDHGFWVRPENISLVMTYSSKNTLYAGCVRIQQNIAREIQRNTA